MPTMCTLVMALLVISVAWTAYSAAVGISSAASSFATSLSLILLLNTLTDAQQRILAQADKALAAMGDTVSSMDVYFLDSACSYTISGNASVLFDIHDIPPRPIKGLTGTRILKQAGTLRICVPDVLGDAHSIEQLNLAGYGAVFLPDEHLSGLIALQSLWVDNEPVCIPVIQQNNVFLLTLMECDAPTQERPTDKFAFPAVSKLLHHTLEEMLHYSTHAPLERLSRLNSKVKGLPRTLLTSRATKVQCCFCDEANAVRQDYPAASDTVHTADNELWQWDMLDMGTENATIDGNQYATVFLVKHTLFLTVTLHATNSGADVVRIMKRSGTRAKLGYWPAVMLSDGAASYNSPEVQALFAKHNIDHQWSNAEQQFQNAVSESVVNMLGRSVCVLLLMSGLPSEFWGPARTVCTPVPAAHSTRCCSRPRLQINTCHCMDTTTTSLSNNFAPICSKQNFNVDVLMCDDALNSALSCNILAAPTIASSPINISSPPDIACTDIPSSPGGGCSPANVSSESGRGSPVNGSNPGGGSPTSGTKSAGERQRFPNERKHKGKRLWFGDKIPLICEKPKHWRDCESKTIANTTDSELAQYLIGYALEFTLPQDFYLKDKTHTTISCSDECKATAKDVGQGFINGTTLMVGITNASQHK
eukprot:999398-Rhodomonas_salina.2